MNIYIISAVRTPIGRFLGSLSSFHPTELAAAAGREAIERAGITSKDIDYYIFGNSIGCALGQNPARRAALLMGIPEDVNGFTLNMVCSSAMMAIISAIHAMKANESKLALVGGMESMSRAPLCLPPEARQGLKHLIMRDAKLIDTMVLDGLTDSWNWKLMGIEADALAKEYGATREELDRIAYESHMRAAKATENNLFRDEIVPIEVKTKKGTIVVDKDEGIRYDTSLEKLAKLPPAFTNDGLHTAGNSSQLSDGAAALVLATEEVVKELGLRPLARIIGYAWVGVKPERFVEAPVPAIKKMLNKLNMKLNDFDYFEINEAFAVSNFIAYKALGIDYDRMNVFGGAIALGHPLGCSGARIVVTLINVLKKKGGKRGIASLCHGTGGGTAVAIELI